MNNGWIKLHRKIMDSPLYGNPNYFRVWIHLLLAANHKPNTFIWNGQDKTVKSGQVLTGRKKIAKALRISESTVERALAYLESRNKIGQQKTTKYRLITIHKWHEYQIVDNKRTTKEQQKNTNKNVKKEKKQLSKQSLPNKKKDMWKQYEEPEIDLDTGDIIIPEGRKMKAEEKKLRAQLRKKLTMLGEHRGCKYNPKGMNADIKTYQQLLLAGWSDDSILKTYLDEIKSPYWKDKKSENRYPSMQTVEYRLRNRKPK